SDMLIRLGKRHHDLGVRPQQYVSMQRSILVSLEELLGAEWNRDYRDAWASVFSFISHVMIKAAAEEAQRVAREGKQEGGKGRGEGGEGGGEASHGEGRGKGCPITAPAHMPVNKVLSGLQLESIHTSHPDGHYLHRTPAKKG
ncbi:globin domain protein, partial [Nannochloropsis gaditana]